MRVDSALYSRAHWNERAEQGGEVCYAVCAVIIPGAPRASFRPAGGDCQMSEESTVTLSPSHNSLRIVRGSEGVSRSGSQTIFLSKASHR